MASVTECAKQFRPKSLQPPPPKKRGIIFYHEKHKRKKHTRGNACLYGCGFGFGFDARTLRGFALGCEYGRAIGRETRNCFRVKSN